MYSTIKCDGQTQGLTQMYEGKTTCPPPLYDGGIKSLDVSCELSL